jgi:hypothetical protein
LKMFFFSSSGSMLFTDVFGCEFRIQFSLKVQKSTLAFVPS